MNDRDSIFDLVVLDLDMPISNGFETCSKIVDLFNERREVAFYKPILLGLQEGELTQQARDNALESGFDTVMASPIDISNVDSEIIPLINDRERAIQNSYNRAMNVEDLLLLFNGSVEDWLNFSN